MNSYELTDYSIEEFHYKNITKNVLRTGEGPAVIVMSEIPGITPKVAEFGRRISNIGCTAVLPSLFGTPGQAPTFTYTIKTLATACIAKEFTALMTKRTSPITNWLRALGAFEHKRCGGPGVGAIGMCFTGGFALGMMLDDRLLAPILSQPSLPLPLRKKQRRSLGISNQDLAAVRNRTTEDDICILGLRFSEDSMAPRERFERLNKEFGNNFISLEIDSSPGNPHRISKRAHSVLTEDLVDQPGHPTHEALEYVLKHLKNLLLETEDDSIQNS